MHWAGNTGRPVLRGYLCSLCCRWSIRRTLTDTWRARDQATTRWTACPSDTHRLLVHWPVRWPPTAAAKDHVIYSTKKSHSRALFRYSWLCVKVFNFHRESFVDDGDFQLFLPPKDPSANSCCHFISMQNDPPKPGCQIITWIWIHSLITDKLGPTVHFHERFLWSQLKTSLTLIPVLVSG